MSIATRIAPHLPFLRRFARAVTGSQKSGDSFVESILESLISDISLFPTCSDDRLALYKLAISLFDTIKIDLDTAHSPYAWEQKAAENLMRLAPPQRQAFLLSAVEGFKEAQISEIMDLDIADTSRLLLKASQEISEQIPTTILIIEDEPLIAMDIEDIVQSLGHTVTGIARTHSEAIEMYSETKPKMVLADIQLADGSSGIDAVNDILTTSDIPVIFITAFPERLLTGERPEPTFLVTKPFNPDMVKALISQALFFNGATE